MLSGKLQNTCCITSMQIMEDGNFWKHLINIYLNRVIYIFIALWKLSSAFTSTCKASGIKARELIIYRSQQNYKWNLGLWTPNPVFTTSPQKMKQTHTDTCTHTHTHTHTRTHTSKTAEKFLQPSFSHTFGTRTERFQSYYLTTSSDFKMTSLLSSSSQFSSKKPVLALN